MILKGTKQTHKADKEYEASSPLNPIKGSRPEVNVNGNIMETWLLVVFPMEIPNKELSKHCFSCKYHGDICCSAPKQEDKMEKRKEGAEKGKQSGESWGAEGQRPLWGYKTEAEEVLSNTIWTLRVGMDLELPRKWVKRREVQQIEPQEPVQRDVQAALDPWQCWTGLGALGWCKVSRDELPAVCPHKPSWAENLRHWDGKACWELRWDGRKSFLKLFRSKINANVLICAILTYGTDPA